MSHWASYQTLVDAWGELRHSPPGAAFSYVASVTADIRFVELQRVAANGDRSPQNFMLNFVPDDWKFHISVDPADLALAWDTMVPYLQEKGIANAKAVAPAKIASFSDPMRAGKPNHLRGKMITLYPHRRIDGKPGHSPDEWQEIIGEIENKLSAAGVKAGPEIITDRKIPGARYCYYRCEQKTSQEIERGSEALLELPQERRFNPTGAADPFAGLELKNKWQVGKESRGAPDPSDPRGK